MTTRCTQCGGRLELASDIRLARCGFCGTALAVDGTETLFHELMVATVPATAVAGHLRRFFSSSAAAAGLDSGARIGEPLLEYFPFWAFTVSDEGLERVVLQPAAPSALHGLQGLQLPAGERIPMSEEATGDAPVQEPEVPPATAREWLRARWPGAAVSRTALIHLPLYRVRYAWQGRDWTAAVDGVAGQVFPADYPMRSETPFRTVAAMALLVFGLEGLLISNLAIKFAVYLLTAVPLLVVAWWTSRTA